MRRKIALLTVLPLVALTAACDHEPPALAGQGWVEVWEDTFDYPSVAAMGEVWELSPPYSAYTPGEVSLAANPDNPDDRIVRLRTGPFQAFPDGTWDWAHISTSGPRAPQGSEPDYPDAQAWQGPLYAEAFVRYTEDRHTWPAFWMFSMHKIESWEPGPHDDCSTPPLPSELTAEWDIMENGWDSNDTTSHYSTSIHRNTPDGTADGWCGIPDTLIPHSSDMPGQVLGNWHLWAGYWRADGQLCTYLDDAFIGCDPAPDSFVQPLAITFDIARIPTAWCAGDPGGCPPLPPELVLEVSNVRVLQPGP